jgi:UDP-hydrolysing UDP-N-acetyl-D-glucosamine 2-epimerase
MVAIREHPRLMLSVIAAGSHLVGARDSYSELVVSFGSDVTDAVPMQVEGRTGRVADAAALGAGIGGLTACFDRLHPDWVLILGDRIEAFAAASAASVAGLAVAHIHGGDRAEGVADEAMRHAITKLAHLHLAATPQSAERIRRMGERPEHVHVVGSPAIDGLAAMHPLPDALYRDFGEPDTLFLMHPIGRSDAEEQRAAEAVLEVLGPRRVLALHPNLDAGRDGILAALRLAERRGVRIVPHLSRALFVGSLKRLAGSGGLLVGNSSAGLIEAAALRLPVVNVGRRQASRESGTNVVHADESTPAVRSAIDRALSIDRGGIAHPFGDGRSGERIAELLARVDPHEPALLRKLCVF